MFNLNFIPPESFNFSGALGSFSLYCVSKENTPIIMKAIDQGKEISVVVRNLTKTKAEIYLLHNSDGILISRPLPGYNTAEAESFSLAGKSITHCFKVTPKQGKEKLKSYIIDLLKSIEISYRVKIKQVDINVICNAFS